MKAILKLTAYLFCTSLCFYTGCVSNDEPEPFDCDTSDLEITLEDQQNVSSCVATDGVIEVSATGGKEDYQFQLDNGSFQSSSTFNTVGPGSHSVTVKDDNGCTATVNNIVIGITGNTLTATTSTVADSECLSDNGTITVNASGGTEPYEYKLNSGAFGVNSVFNGVKEGSHVVTVKDATGCTFSLNNVVVAHGITGVTYNGSILAIFQANCLIAGCHLNNGNGQGNWGVYSTAFNKRAEIRSRTQSGDMPRTGSLTANEKALIACWVDDGAPLN